uniref:Non-ribosomal peptide synthetase n=1 Tax=Claviceps purpurea TaxID=5111 RepID=A6N9L3_CLAPU|nr:non-ribosomal peptide synthetase [Claviceps purpurea]
MSQSGNASSITPPLAELEDLVADMKAPMPEAPRVLPIPADIGDKLAEHLTAYMMPKILITMKKLPMTATGKLDRRRLREIGSSFSAQELAELQMERDAKREPRTILAKQMQQVWAKVLNIQPEIIGLDDSFFRLGGDSIAAMKLVGEMRKHGVELAVADIFRYPTLDLATKQGNTFNSLSSIATEVIKPFSLLFQRTRYRLFSFKMSRSASAEVSGSGGGCLPLALRFKKDCYALNETPQVTMSRKSVLELAPGLDLEAFRRAWGEVARGIAILRTRVVQHRGSVIQVVLDEKIDWHETTNLISTWKPTNEINAFEPALVRYALVKDASGAFKWFVWTVHHALYDDWSLSLIIDAVHQAFCGKSVDFGPQFTRFIEYLSNQDYNKLVNYWHGALSSYTDTSFPALPPSIQHPRADRTLQGEIFLPRKQQSGITLSNLLRAAWALVAGDLTNSQDVVFGMTMSGRGAQVPGLNKMAAPTIVTVPVRVTWSKDQKVSDYVNMVQNQATDMIPFEQAGLQKIAKICPGSHQACQFQTLIVIQAPGSDSISTYALMLDLQLGLRQRYHIGHFDPNVIEEPTVKGYSRGSNLFSAARYLDPKMQLEEVNMMTEQDLQKIWHWNGVVPQTAERCVHELVEEKIQSNPDASAICAWDGSLTYGQLGDLVTILAGHLAHLGIGPGVIVPLCFEKSMWTTPPLLLFSRQAVLHLTTDPLIPEQRLAAIAQQIEMKLLISSTSNSALGSRLAHTTLVLCSDFFTSHLIRSSSTALHASPADLMYVVFTSGSTGTPKGVKIAHKNLASAIHHQAEALGFNSSSRFYDFTSYSFDTCIANIFFTLASGGCLCVPSDGDRKSNLGASVATFRANLIELTPTVAQTLVPNDVPEIRSIAFGGEAYCRGRRANRLYMTLSDGGERKVSNTYGPAECTPTSKMNIHSLTPEETTRIGFGAGARTWIVNPDDYHQLLPVGCVGELLLEGPIVGLGYLNDDEQTNTVFVKDPAWLQKGAGCLGRDGRLYRTGDLVRYNTDGSLTFMGRKDDQVKLRGQRIELNEVEAYIKKALSKSQRFMWLRTSLHRVNDDRPILVAFISILRDSHDAEDEGSARVLLSELTEDLEDTLAATLPSYMVPSVFLEAKQMPTTPTGKIDRRALRVQAGCMTKDELVSQNILRRRAYCAPDSVAEKQLQGLWSSVLGLEISSIGSNDSFFRIGGDSIQAMRLAGAAREQGFSLTVADTFKYPKLRDLAKMLSQNAVTSLDTPNPYSLLDSAVDRIDAQSQAATMCQVSASQVVDILPCSPLQEGLLAMTLKRPGDYIYYNEYLLAEDVDALRFKMACEKVITANPILRTRIRRFAAAGQCKLSLTNKFVGRMTCQRSLTRRQWALGTQLALVGLTTSAENGRLIFHWILHHALYDAWSFSMMLDSIEAAYSGLQKEEKSVPFSSFVGHILAVNKEEAAEYWRTYLHEIDSSTFPVLPALDHSPRPDAIHLALDAIVQLDIDNITWPQSDITASTVIRTAWALLQATNTGRDDVLYGATVAGRQRALPGIDRVMGPTIATVPVRVSLDWNGSTVGALLLSVQSQFLEAVPFEQIGLQNIRKLSEDAEIACNFQTLLVTQPTSSDDDKSGRPQQLFHNCRNSEGHDDLAIFNTYCITVSCDYSKFGVQIAISYDTAIINYAEANRLLLGLEHFICELCKPGVELKSLKDLTAVTDHDMRKLWEKNAVVPDSVHVCVHDLIAQTIQRQPQAPAVCAWDDMLTSHELTYGELDRLSTQLAHQLVRLGVAPGEIIPLCFERSVWTSVAMLGVMKAGGASVALEITQPLERLRSIVQQVSPITILASSTSESIAAQLHDSVKVKIVSRGTCEVETDGNLNELPSRATPSDPLYVVFTSGTTGKPKGVVVSHASFSSASVYQRKALGFTTGDRVLGFASPAFDLFWSNHLNTLITGCCIYTPTESQRTDNLAGFIADQQITLAHLTPSTARLLRSNLSPTMSTLILGGELVSREDFDCFSPSVNVKITYGPSECSPTSTILDTNEFSWRTGNIGEPKGLCAWVVHPVRHTLAAPGSVGELWLEGRLVASGYLRDPEKTAAAFIEDPAWLLRGGPGVPGRRGRVYRTGDLVRYDIDNGTIHFVGRKDSQVKIRGQRVELAEVELHIRQVLVHKPGVEVAVDVITTRDSTKPILVAFISLPSQEISARDGDKVQAGQKSAVLAVHGGLRRAIGQTYSCLYDSICLSAHPYHSHDYNRQDRQQSLKRVGAALSLAEIVTQSQKKPTAPSSDIEVMLATIWAQTLNLPYESISVDVPFTKIGGDSISAMQVVARSRSMGLKLTVSDVLRHLTIEKIVPHGELLRSSRTTDDLHTEQDNQPWQLSPIQNMFFMAHPSGLHHFNQSFAFRLASTVTVTHLRMAAETLVSRHPMLRARFRLNIEGKWEQYTVPNDENAFTFKVHRLREDEDSGHLLRERQKTLHIITGPVFAIDCLLLGGDNHDNDDDSTTFDIIVLFTAHHLIIDLVSWRIIWYEMEQLVKGSSNLPAPSTSFKSWVCKQATTERVSDAGQLLPFQLTTNLPNGALHPSDNTISASSDIHGCLDSETTSLLLGKSNDSMRTDTVDIMVAVISHSLRQHFPERCAPAIFLEGHGREPSDDTSVDLSETIGWFTTICPVQVPLSHDHDVVDAVKFVKDTRRRIPGKGLTYFNNRYGVASAENGACQAKFEPVEFLLNYAGIYQQIEREESIFSPLDVDLMELSSDTIRTALVEINCGVRFGELHVSVTMHNRMKHRDRLEQWAKSLGQQFQSALQALIKAGRVATLVDYSLLRVSYKTLENLMAHLGRMEINIDNVADIFPCTPLQEGILLSMSKTSSSYRIVNIWKCISGDGKVDVSRLESAWRSAIARHSVFRIIFVESAGYQGFLQVQLLRAPVKITVLRTDIDSSSPEHTLRSLEWPHFKETEPEYAITICGTATGHVACRFDISHALIDATSFAILLRDVREAYHNSSSAQAAPSFGHAVEEIMKTPHSDRLVYWKKYLAGVKACRLPSIPQVADGCAEFQQGWLPIPLGTSSLLHSFCQAHCLTRSTVLYVAWALVLSQLTGSRDICFGYLASGRDIPIKGVHDLVGPLINLLIGRINVSLPIDDVLAKTNQDSIDHFSFQHVSLAELQREIGMQGDQLFTTSITIRHDLDDNCAPDGDSLGFDSVEGEDPHEVRLTYISWRLLVQEFLYLLTLVYSSILFLRRDETAPDTEMSLNYNMSKISQSLVSEAADVFAAAITYLTDIRNNCTQEPLDGAFFRYTTGVAESKALSTWKGWMQDLETSHFPSLPHPSYMSQRQVSETHYIGGISTGRNAVQTIAILWTSWALLLATNSNSSDVVFGSATPYEAMENCNPENRQSASTVPVRVKIDYNQTVGDKLNELGAICDAVTQYRRISAHWLRRISEQGEQFCAFQSALEIRFASSASTVQHESQKEVDCMPLRLTCVVTECSLQLTVHYDDQVLNDIQARRLYRQFEAIFRQLCNPKAAKMKLHSISVTPEQEMREIWQWNANVPRTARACVHDLIADTIRRQPHAQAINAWDGELTYGELDTLSSQLASSLLETCQIRPGTIVTLCFEKSMWTPVAMLGVMKAGGASVAMDVTQPSGRLREILRQSSSTIILTSQASESLAQSLAVDLHEQPPTILAIPKSFKIDRATVCQPPRTSVVPEDMLYVVFTSGSTGTPKGIAISHANFSSAILHQQDVLCYQPSSRVFDSASYAFDVAWFNVLFTLKVGGCLCIPNENDRRGDISGAIRSLKANYVELTATVGRLIKAAEVPCLQTIQFCGERLTLSALDQWHHVEELFHCYGPAECTAATTVNRIMRVGDQDPHIGKGCGTVTWVVSTRRYGLASIGEVGELWVEGPLVAMGYLNNPEKTSSSFIEDPVWLLQGGPGVPGRHGRLYRTGDLVRYDDDGNLHFIGRTDDQVKIRGQRVQLGEIEAHIRTAMPSTAPPDLQITVEMVKLQDCSNPILVSFIHLPGPPKVLKNDVKNGRPHKKHSQEEDWHCFHAAASQMAQGLEEKLAGVLPSYMIPSACLVVDSMPMTATGKTDRRELRAITGRLTQKELAMQNVARSHKKLVPVTATEVKLRQVWSDVLDTSTADISTDDSFLQIGGDSVQAMRLAGALREQSLCVTVAEIFKHLRLRDLAKLLSERGSTPNAIASPASFSLLRNTVDYNSASAKVAALCGVDTSQIQDIFPCTPLQQGLLAITTRRSGDFYVSHNEFVLGQDIERPKFQSACHKAVKLLPILRTRIVDLPGQGLVQAVIDEDAAWYDRSITTSEIKMGLGTRLAIFGLVSSADTGRLVFHLILHHSLFDGWSYPLMLSFIQDIYLDKQPMKVVPFQNFVQYTLGCDAHAASLHWQSCFDGITAVMFPALPSPDYSPNVDGSLEHMIEDCTMAAVGYNRSTVVQTAWALVQSVHTATDDVVFGAVVTGRQALPGVDRIIGPTLATIPCRVTLNWQATISDFLQQMQQSLDDASFQQTGLQNIRKASADAGDGLRLPDIAHHPACAARKQSGSFFELRDDPCSENSTFDTYASWSKSFWKPTAYYWSLKYDSALWVLHMSGVSQSIRKHFTSIEHLRQLVRLSHDDALTMRDIQVVTEECTRKIWKWNATVPQPIDTCVHDLIAETVRKQPRALAVSSWDGNLLYSELEELSYTISKSSHKTGVRPGLIIPLYFEKSKWLIAMLGVMKAGGASVAIDISQPLERLREIARQVAPTIILTSATGASLAGKHTCQWFDHCRHCGHFRLRTTQVKDTRTLQETRLDPLESQRELRSLTQISPQRAIIKAKASGLTAVRCARTFLFCVYVFWSTSLNSFISGACLCIPTESQRKDDLSGFMNQQKVTLADLTPSTAKVIRTCPPKYLKTLILGGELVSLQEFESLFSSSINIKITYGPAECTPTSSILDTAFGSFETADIGHCWGLCAWVAHPTSHNLIPPGLVGELWLEGPLVGMTYLNDNDKTKASFVDDPSWLLRGVGPEELGRRHGRLYRTGDLVRYNEDGSLHFIVRKDDQVKIRGQRVELDEVEMHIRGALGSGNSSSATDFEIVADVVTPRGSKIPILVSFISVQNASESFVQEMDREVRDGIGERKDGEKLRVNIERLLEGLDEKLTAVIPSYMIPSVYLEVGRIPMTTSGKTDRRKLRATASGLSLEELTSKNLLHRCKHREPTTDREKRMRRIWAEVLEIDETSISADDSFLQIGGDSIQAMRLTGIARERGFLLTVAGIFKTPSFLSLAKSTVASDMQRFVDVPEPFSLLSTQVSTRVDKEEARLQISSLCGVSTDQVEDILPCIPLQEGMLAMTAKGSGNYVAYYEYILAKSVDASRFRNACQAVVSALPILRTRIADLPGHGLVQAVISEKICWGTTSGANFPATSPPTTMEPGSPLVLFELSTSDSGRLIFRWTLHHALFDGWTLPLMLQAIEDAYYDKFLPKNFLPFSTFVGYVQDTDNEALVSWWLLTWMESARQYSLRFLSQTTHRGRMAHLEETIKVNWPQSDITPSTIVRTAWALLQAMYTSSDDVIFGATVTGQHAAIPGIESIVGPTIATVPYELLSTGAKTLENCFMRCNNRSLDVTPFEQVGLQRLRKISHDAEMACNFQTCLWYNRRNSHEDSVEPFFESLESRAGSTSSRVCGWVKYLCSYGTMRPQRRRFQHDAKLRLLYYRHPSDRTIHESVAPSCRANVQDWTKWASLSDVVTIAREDLLRVWQWNKTVPAPIDSCVHDLIADAARKHPQAPAVCAWDGELTYEKLDRLSTQVAHRLSKLGVGRGTVVPLCFEKSMWMPVAALGVMKAGGASVALDTTQPLDRLRNIVNQVEGPSSNMGCQLILASSLHEALSNKLMRHGKQNKTLVLSDLTLREDHETNPKDLPASGVVPADSLYVVFTSGSTGHPKGVVITHSNFSSAIIHQRSSLDMQQSSRVFDFASYAFDAAWMNILHTLAAGACLCIPSEEDRRSDVSGAIQKLRANYAYLIAHCGASYLSSKTFRPCRRLKLVGERLTKSVVDQWRHIDTLINAYGPAENSVLSTLGHIKRDESPHPSIGKGCGTVTWIVSTQRGGLASIGEVGELWVEGPLVAKGYLNDPGMTKEKFIRNPPWLLQGAPGISGRVGLLYKTGDLVRYDNTGSLHFVGRMDDQVKIRGQRIELGEVEVHVGQSIVSIESAEVQVVADVVTPRGYSDPILIAFISLYRNSQGHGENGGASRRESKNHDVNDSNNGHGNGNDNSGVYQQESLLLAASHSIRMSRDKISSKLPSYMVPSVCLLLDAFPMTSTGKIDRRTLRRLASCMTREQLASENMLHDRPVYRHPSTVAEKQLQKLWSEVLGLEPRLISADDSFLQIGGDSIQAMRLIGAAREQGLALTVADVLGHHSMSRLAQILESTKPELGMLEPVEPFSLLPKDVRVDDITPLTETKHGNMNAREGISDIFPVTDLQTSYISAAMQDPPSSCSIFYLTLPGQIAVEDLVKACEFVWSQLDALRVAFVEYNGRYWQVIPTSSATPARISIHRLDADESNEKGSLHDEVYRKALMTSLRLGTTYTEFMISRSPSQLRLGIRMTHAQYDGISFGELVAMMSAHLAGRTSMPARSSPTIFEFALAHEAESLKYWRNVLQGSQPLVLAPRVPSPLTIGQDAATSPTSSSTRSLKTTGSSTRHLTRQGSPLLRTLSRMRYALSKVTTSTDVVFGFVVSGRAALQHNLSNVFGPCVNVVPIRASIASADMSLTQLSLDLQQQRMRGRGSKLALAQTSSGSAPTGPKTRVITAALSRSKTLTSSRRSTWTTSLPKLHAFPEEDQVDDAEVLYRPMRSRGGEVGSARGRCVGTW